jgi:hypothetical protein
MPNIPNLDCIPQAELMAFWFEHQSGRNCKALGLAGKGSVEAANNLSCYAANKSAAMDCRLKGDIPAALMYEGICDRIYGRLPESARW